MVFIYLFIYLASEFCLAPSKIQATSWAASFSQALWGPLNYHDQLSAVWPPLVDMVWGTV